MKLLKVFLAIFFAFFTLFTYAQEGLNNPITKAMMKVYEKQLEEDPHDYETYYKRAIEYYNHNHYAKALDDINNALSAILSLSISLNGIITSAKIFALWRRCLALAFWRGACLITRGLPCCWGYDRDA